MELVELGPTNVNIHAMNKRSGGKELELLVRSHQVILAGIST